MAATPKQTSDDLVIIKMVAENFKRLKAVSIEPDGSLVVLSGKNRQGKSSILDAIWAAVSGKGVIQKEPIRQGEDKAMIKLDLGPAGGPVEVVVTRTFKRTKEGSAETYTTAITVASPEGAQFPQPQAFMDRILGALALDPVEFLRMKMSDKVEMLQKLVPGVDFDAMDRTIDGAFNNRAQVNRDIKSVTARRDAITVDPTAPTEEIDVSAVAGEMEAATNTNTEIETRKRNREAAALQADSMDRGVARTKQEIADLEDKLLDAKTRLGNEEKAVAELRTKIAEAPELPPLVDLAPFRAQIANASGVNDKVRARKVRDALTAELKDLDAKADAFTKIIEDTEAAKKKAIDEAGLPVPGIAFGKFGVTLNGLPFDQASDAEQWGACIRIAAAIKPTLGIIRVRDGSLLDSDARAALAAFAAERKMQVWIECVDESGQLGFVIEDGMVKAHNAPEHVEPAAAEQGKLV